MKNIASATSPRSGGFTELMPDRGRLARGLSLAAALWLLFMLATAYTSAATLLDRVASTDVMRAASGVVWQGKIAWQITAFVLAVIALHLIFAGLTWLLAVASAVISAEARGKFALYVVGWFCVLAGATLVYNALWFPRTLIGAHYHGFAAASFGSLTTGQGVYYLVLALCSAVLLLASFKVMGRLDQPFRGRSLAATVFLVALLAVASVGPAHRQGSATAAPAGRPNVIIIGIDSLRLEQLARFGGKGLTPNLDKFLSQADLFADTTTPLARTFSSWTAILTGRSPPRTGARFNLAPRESVQANPTIADVMRRAGYRTVYSTDEVRFANFDESYGFDDVVTPRIGAADFIVGTYNELPLSSLVINTRLGRWLFPFSYANRGVATMYQPETYLDLVQRTVEFDEPTLFIAHLCAAHWPYHTSETPFGVSRQASPDDRPMYRIGLQTADRMFGDLLEILRKKGALDNAIVVVLSDHGEAMGLPSDSFFSETFLVEGLGAPLKMDDHGHGQSVLSRSQYQVLLGFRSFGPSHSFGVAGRTIGYPVTVEDVAPTLLDLMGVSDEPLQASGVSLRPFLESGSEGDPQRSERIRFTETDLRVLPAPGGGVDEAATARQNSVFFEVEPRTARLRVRPALAPLAIAFKERAAFTPDQLLAAMPADPYSHQYIYLDFRQRKGRLLMERPGADDPVAQRLWDALAENYKGELHEPTRVTIGDWKRIEMEWSTFLQARDGRGSPTSSAGGAG